MGIAAYNRGSRAISEQFDREQPDTVSRMIRHLNDLPKAEGAARPFADVHFAAGNGGWWALCPTTGFGYWHRTLRDAVASFRVVIVDVRRFGGELRYVGIPS